MDIQSIIGNTPIVKLDSLSKPNLTVYAKLEGQNPAGSVKDRAAYQMIKGAFERDEIRAGSHLVEATSGNTGIALAMIAAKMGCHISLIMPDNATRERIDIMRAYGAEVVLTPAEKTIEYSREYAEKLVLEKGYVMLNQFANDDNWKAHYLTTGPEIWMDTDGQVTHFVSAMGTTGTIMGVSRFLKEMNPDIQIIGAQPVEGNRIPGIRRWSAAFLPKIYDPSRVDQIIDVSRDEAIGMMKYLSLSESLFCGISGGGAVAAVQKTIQSLEEGVVVCILPDRGDRYLSSGVFS